MGLCVCVCVHVCVCVCVCLCTWLGFEPEVESGSKGGERSVLVCVLRIRLWGGITRQSTKDKCPYMESHLCVYVCELVQDSTVRWSQEAKVEWEVSLHGIVCVCLCTEAESGGKGGERSVLRWYHVCVYVSMEKEDLWTSCMLTRQSLFRLGFAI